MKICINVKVWQRPEVFRNVLRSIRDQETVHEIIIVAGLSEDDPHYEQNYITCSEYDVFRSFSSNLPLSNKANALCQFSSQLEWDYLMILGSDDVVGPHFFDACIDHVRPASGPLNAWGWSDLYMWEPYQEWHNNFFPDDPEAMVMFPERFCYWPGYNPNKRDESIGAGRILRRDVVEQLDWQLHKPGMNKLLDLTMTARLKAIGVTVPHGKLPEGVYLVDCKDEVSITKMSQFDQGVLVDMAVPDVLRGYL